MRWLAFLALLIATPAAAQVVSAPTVVDTSSMDTRIDAATTAAQNAAAVAVAAQAAAANACQPLASVPPPEVVGGTAGSGSNCRLANAVQPRITRAGSCVLSTGGTCTVTWTTALAAVPNIIMEPINAGTLPVDCNLTATPTTTSASIKCWTAQSVTVSVLGAVVSPFTTAASGVTVQITAIPPTQ